jgi:hypothetical protein
VVKLNAVTENVTLLFIGTVWLAGWIMMTGGGPRARQGLATKKIDRRKQLAAFFNLGFLQIL